MQATLKEFILYFPWAFIHFLWCVEPLYWPVDLSCHVNGHLMAFPIMRRIKCAKYASLAINAAWRGFPFEWNLSPGQGLHGSVYSSSLLASSGRGLGPALGLSLRLRSGHDLQFCVHQPRTATIVIFREFLHVLAFHLHRTASCVPLPMAPRFGSGHISCLLASIWPRLQHWIGMA